MLDILLASSYYQSSYTLSTRVAADTESHIESLPDLQLFDEFFPTTQNGAFRSSMGSNTFDNVSQMCK